MRISFTPTQPYDLHSLPPTLDCTHDAFMPALLRARTELAELKGYSHTLPNPLLLLRPAIIRESVASSEIENINTTVEKALQQQIIPQQEQSIENKEVLRYKDAVVWGYEAMKTMPLCNRIILGIHKELLGERSHGYRKVQNSIVNTTTGKVLYTPPRASEIPRLIGNWERYVHAQEENTDPLIRCAVAHYQFEAIHPFGDGNGRTGRILMVLSLIQEEILLYPILYISGYVNSTRSEYYRLLHGVTAKKKWSDYIQYMLRGFYLQAKETKEQMFAVTELLAKTRDSMRKKVPAVYTADIVELFFSLPYITPARMAEMLGIHYTTASRHLKILQKHGFLKSEKSGKYQFYINHRLMDILNNRNA